MGKGIIFETRTLQGRAALLRTFRTRQYGILFFAATQRTQHNIIIYYQIESLLYIYYYIIKFTITETFLRSHIVI